MELAVRALHKAFDLEQGRCGIIRIAAAQGAVTEWPKVLPC